MVPEYRFLFDERFLIDALWKYRKQHGFRYASLAIKSIGGLVLAVAALVAWKVAWWLALFFVGSLLLVLNGHLLGFWLVKRRFRKSPYWNDRMVGTLTAEGFHVVGSQSESRFAWSVFTKARVFRDGVLLLQGPGIVNWLPDAALWDGTREEVETLIRANVKLVEYSRPGRDAEERAPHE